MQSFHALSTSSPLLSSFAALNTETEPLDVARAFLAHQGIDKNEYKLVDDWYTDLHTGVTHMYFRQVVDGIEVLNGDINLNIMGDGTILSYGSSFYTGAKPQGAGRGLMGSVQKFFGLEEDKVVSPTTALHGLMSHLRLPLTASNDITITPTSTFSGSEPIFHLENVPGALKPAKAHRAYYQTAVQNPRTGVWESGLKLVWAVEVDLGDHWVSSAVDAVTGKEVLGVVDWVSDASYNVFPLGTNDPEEGPRVLLKNPHDLVASPFGWHGTSANTTSHDTTGNNVWAQANPSGGYEWKELPRPKSKKLDFDFRYNETMEPKSYVDAAVTNLFYVNNAIHDLFYRYGFTEAAGNFQTENFGRGGRGGDCVIANAQDGSGYDNANFATPPDGQNGRMRMYVWDQTKPFRDGDMESGIVIHEYCHGLSTRLTGGPMNSNCLGWGEAGGMGEGWGDFFATVLRMMHTDTHKAEFGMGEYANGGEGIRNYMYSRSKEHNKDTYASCDKPGYWGVHAKGEVWAEMLYEVLWNLVDEHGFSPYLLPPVDHNTTDMREGAVGTPFSVEGKNKKLPNAEAFFHPNTTIPAHGNTLALQLVIDGLKLQPCRPSFAEARDAIIAADLALTGGENKCAIWKGFAKRGLGVGAKLVGGTPWGGGVREESRDVPGGCERKKGGKGGKGKKGGKKEEMK
ncbi:hypothetical protein G7K_3703-t1 [Saitoella complicata NRRL Y-17804]|uniref:Extracellular metalloproteinase n=1 Tax=Saitoella complicata (strain BCRC 22490 / CBS 7301 / JCM 7358 / NBRC 10748 / NRRL Y-17804) TaxID=698492 RepID=A0A0E9NI82_SAICN|nr:hypothetical protein G7K_3703-t1 [Saitoella complicata NRRL Y-17804]